MSPRDPHRTVAGNVVHVNFRSPDSAGLDAPHPTEQNHRRLHWAGARIVNAVEIRLDSARISRGRSLFTKGLVHDIDLDTRIASGFVRGSQHHSYRVEMSYPPLFGQPDVIADAFRPHKYLLAAIAQGIDPGSIRDVLVPEVHRISFSCQCPDSRPVCKHIYAFSLALAAELTDNPAQVLTLLGLTIEQLRALVDGTSRAHPSGGGVSSHTQSLPSASESSGSASSASMSDPLNTLDAETFWGDAAKLPPLPTFNSSNALLERNMDGNLLNALATAMPDRNERLRLIQELEDCYYVLEKDPSDFPPIPLIDHPTQEDKKS